MLRKGRRDLDFSWLSTNSKIYLNWAAAERIRQDVVDVENKFRALQQSYEDEPKKCMAALKNAVELARSKMAAMLNISNPGHIIFTTGSEDSLKTVLFAHALVPWGSHIVTTDCEFYGVYNKILPPRYHPAVAGIWTAKAKGDIVDAIVSKVTDKTRLMLLSHVCYNSGLRLPLQEIIEQAKTVNPSLLVLVDGAQALGQIPVDINEIGCDFYAGDAHKWLLGPDQTGFLYVQNAKNLNILARDSSSIFSICSELNHNKGSRSGAIAYELAALSETIDPFVESDSLSGICQRGAFLAELFRKSVSQQLADVFEIAAHVPDAFKTNIVCLRSIENKNATRLINFVQEELLKRGIHCAAINHSPEGFEDFVSIPPLLRFCFHYWNSEKEVDFTVQSLCEIAQDKQNEKIKRAASHSV